MLSTAANFLLLMGRDERDARTTKEDRLASAGTLWQKIH